MQTDGSRSSTIPRSLDVDVQGQRRQTKGADGVHPTTAPGLPRGPCAARCAMPRIGQAPGERVTTCTYEYPGRGRGTLPPRRGESQPRPLWACRSPLPLSIAVQVTDSLPGAMESCKQSSSHWSYQEGDTEMQYHIVERQQPVVLRAAVSSLTYRIYGYLGATSDLPGVCLTSTVSQINRLSLCAVASAMAHPDSPTCRNF